MRVAEVDPATVEVPQERHGRRREATIPRVQHLREFAVILRGRRLRTRMKSQLEEAWSHVRE